MDVAFPLKEGKITLLCDFFKFCNFCLSIKKFCKQILDHYCIHISQLHPGIVKGPTFCICYVESWAFARTHRH
ncbi:hypothetical protein Hanom_Chr01g00007431 [Helianthus anomalus]